MGDSVTDPFAPSQPTWIKYECDQGCRWTAVKGEFCQIPDGDECHHSSCLPGHKVRAVGETTSLDEAHAWFRDTHQEINENDPT